MLINSKMASLFNKGAILLFCCFIFIASLAYCIMILYDYHSDRKVYNDSRNLYTVKSIAGDELTTPKPDDRNNPTQGLKSQENKLPKVSDKFQSLLQINGDTVGWIKIENTQIDYPVVKSTDNNCYLHYNFKKEVSFAGCIFMDCGNNISPLDRNTILYGHNMKDSSMFHDLIKYKEEDFFNSNDKITFDTLYQENVWQVFSVYVTDVNFNYLVTNFANVQDYGSFTSTIKAKSMFKKDMTLNAGDHILTLSTCSYEFPNARTVVHAKLLS